MKNEKKIHDKSIYYHIVFLGKKNRRMNIIWSIWLITGINIRPVVNITKRRALGKALSGTISLRYPTVPNIIVVKKTAVY